MQVHLELNFGNVSWSNVHKSTTTEAVKNTNFAENLSGKYSINKQTCQDLMPKGEAKFFALQQDYSSVFFFLIQKVHCIYL